MAIDIIPDFTPLNVDWSTVSNYLWWIIILGILLGVLMRLIQHRMIVNIYEKVQSGYVLKKGRYAIITDKESGLDYLRPMFGKDKLPSFPDECWQKINGVPMIGAKRRLCIIKQNKHSFNVLNPPADDKIYGNTSYHDTLSWVFVHQKDIFIKKLKKADFAYMMSIAAPSFIIIACITFWIVAIFSQSSITMHAKDQITQATDQIVNYCMTVMKG